MRKIINAFGLILLIHVLAAYFSYLVFTYFNLDFYTLFNQNLGIAFGLHSMSIGFLYAFIRWILGKWYKEAYHYPFQTRILFGLLFIAYASVFIAENQGLSYWDYFFWFNYPLGVFFKSVNAYMFDFELKLSVFLGIAVQAVLFGLGDGLDRRSKRSKRSHVKSR